MGSIYRAHDPEIDRPVAIKLIHADLLGSEDKAEFVARFRREAQAAARCAHPNIVAIYDFALQDANPFLAMEFVDGVTIAQAKPPGGVFDPADAVFIMLQVLDALQAAHAMGIVHRDIKPANIMLIGGTRVKVADFGIARMDTSSLTQNEAVIGTPSYMSPEQCRGEKVDTRSDLFSAGVVLFEMLTGQKPFAGRNATETFAKLLHGPDPDVARLLPEESAGLAGVVARSLSRPMPGRFAAAADMAAALRDAAAASGTEFTDRTIILPQRAPAQGASPTSFTGRDRFDPALIETLSRKLTELLGPIGPYLVQNAVRNSATVDDLCASLATKLEEPAHRTQFNLMVQHQLKSPTEPSPADLETLRTALARHLGPVARVLVKRAAADGASGEALWERLAAHIEDAGARAVFLKEGKKVLF